MGAGSSGLNIENLKVVGSSLTGAHQYPADHLAFRYLDISGGDDGIRSIGSWDNSGQHDIAVEHNYIHDIPAGSDGGYAIRAQGNATDWTVRYNRFEGITEDYIQSGEPSGWVVTNNQFGPGTFNRPRGYTGHPDVWQMLDPGSNITFTDNVVRDTNESLGFILGAMGGPRSYRDVTVTNNLFVKPVYGVGESCQFSPTIGFVFEQNTLVDARGCRWGSGSGQSWPDAADYSIKRNVLSGSSFLSCNDTAETNSCRAYSAGLADNYSAFTDFAETTYYTPNGVPANVGARLSDADFPGYPFE